MSERWPNLFIVGAAKSGTTSIYYYLKIHPDIYFSTPKEPSFFSNKYLNYPFSEKDKRAKFFMSYLVKSKKDYLDLFNNHSDFRILAEATPNYLFYYDSAYEIKKYSPDAKIIIMLRNPIDRAFSQYIMNVRDLDETESFENALKLEEMRIAQNFHYAWFYKKAGLYYEQVKRFIEVFGKVNVKIILYDDFSDNTANVLKDICQFLNIESNVFNNFKFEKFNVSGRPRIKFVNYLIRQNNILRNIAKKILPYHFRHKMSFKILKLNSRKEVMNKETREELREYFRENIIQLEKLIQVDLAKWIQS